MKKNTKIMIVEDDTDINNILATALKREGYEVLQAYSGTESKLILELNGQDISLMLLDLMLPGISGEEVLSYVRDNVDIPVIVISAKDSIDSKLTLLTSGADDYIIKPFDIKEVVARVQIQLRHMERNSEKAVEDNISYKDMLLDKVSFSVYISGIKLEKITKQEFAILELLLKNPKQAFSKEDIFEYAWDEPYMGETKTLDVHISNIRKKIRAVTEEEYIETIWVIGYRLKN